MTAGLSRAWLRLFLLQASFNYDRMVGIGAAFAAEPLLRSLPEGRSGRRYREAMARAAEFFNTHPFLAGLGVGALARAEHEGEDGELVRRLRQTLVSPLGSVGDRLVWAGILPIAAGLGLSVAAFTSPFAGALSFLILFNVAHLWLRTWALKAGWRCGKTVAAALSARGVQLALKVAGPAAAFVVGAALPLTWEWLAVEFAPRTQASIVVVAGVALIMARWIVPSLGSLRFGLLAAAVALVTAWLR